MNIIKLGMHPYFKFYRFLEKRISRYTARR
jgi:hypothetical protein